jgi:hypothetical protein
MRAARWSSLVLVLASAPRLLGQHGAHQGPAPPPAVRSPGAIHGPDASTSSFPTPAFDRDGRLWLAFVEGSSVYVTSSGDLGKPFAPAVAVNREPERIDANGEGRPKIAFGKDGVILVTWTQKLDKPYSGLIRFARSTDGGRSFSAPVTLNDDGLVTGHRFDALAVSPSGDVLVAWIDKRDLERAQARGKSYAGAAVYLTTSDDSGATFRPNRKVKDNVCECCRLAFAFDASGHASLLVRDVLDGGIRDHVLVQSVGSADASTRRVTFDDWKIDACPHHGPSLWIDDAGRYHIAWFTAGERSGTGVFYARSEDGGKTFQSPVAVGQGERATHPFLLGSSGTVYLAWMEVDGRESIVRIQQSPDGGGRWSPPITLARGASGADHPLLVKRGEEVFLSWFTRDAGYRLMPLPRNASPSQ